MTNFKYLAGVLLLATVFCKHAKAADMTVTDLYKLCTSSDDADKSGCRFYIFGVFQAAQLVGETEQEKSGEFTAKQNKRFCVPENLSDSAMELDVKVRLGSDLAVYPQDRDLSAVGFIVGVIARDFPCQNPTVKPH